MPKEPKPKKSPLLRLGNVLAALFTLGCLGILVITAGVFFVVFHYSKDLPDYRQLAKYNPPTVTRLYAADGQMLAEYATEKRLYVPIEAIPKRLVNAFIAAEDKNFYNHPGIDFSSILRAAIKNLLNYGQNKSLVGGSTISQQVVKNFLLTKEQSLTRKIKEAILAFRITQAFSKDRILELYLNEIYLGNRSYGVAAAALNYFNKSLSELTVEEAALLAAMPKAPSSLDPGRFPERAKTRRDWVISRMEEEGYINDVEALLSAETPINLAERDTIELVNATFFSDTVKQELIDMYGEEQVSEGGLAVRTTLDPVYQRYAEKALMDGLIAYDRRHGWRGPITPAHPDKTVDEMLEGTDLPPVLGGWKLAAVVKLHSSHVDIQLKTGGTGTIGLEHMSWARKFVNRDTLGPKIKTPSQVLNEGDVIVVSAVDEDKNIYALEQIPEINGAIVAMDPHTGRVLAMVGGYYYAESQFNRATQAQRQPGSAFKPFVYLAALENGFTPSSLIVDEEIQLERGEDIPEWRPQNHSGEYYGPTTLRTGVEKSRNAMTVRLAQLMGIDKVVEIARRFGITDTPERNFSLALGAAETNLLNLTNSYAMLVNGGKRIHPSLVERIQSNNGRTIYKRDNRPCNDCVLGQAPELFSPDDKFAAPPVLVDQRETIADPVNLYQMVSILEGVIQRGTGRGARNLAKTLAGKTGTTNESFDAWFMGFSADLVVGVYAGFDTPKSLGKHEYGSSVALPIWRDFIENALADKPDIPFRRPKGVKLVKVDVRTGLLPAPDTPKEDIIYEAFKAGTEPSSTSTNRFDALSPDNTNGSLDDLGTGEVY